MSSEGALCSSGSWQALPMVKEAATEEPSTEAVSFQEELSVLLTDIHQYKRNLDEHFSKLINNKSRIAVSAMRQESLSLSPSCPAQPLLLPPLAQQAELISRPVP